MHKKHNALLNQPSATSRNPDSGKGMRPVMTKVWRDEDV